MALAPGTRLGPYTVTAAIGAGGMGEVYRARDPRLDRDVAVKVLPSAFSADPERLTRFEQEARAAAALNHPNILAVHDVGQHDGSPYIVSELLDGETLRERLHGGALPVRKAVEYAVQIAHGLASAHDRGITHRDLKPENVFVTADGRMKILDFGLAKLTHAEPAAAALSALPTTPANTLPGVVLGTIGYMAPEQVRGLAADHRSDIFAFGAILYEMLSGRRAFSGETAADTMTAILKEDPPDLPATERHIPSGLERIVDRCLEKDPSARFKSADDLAFALEALATQSSPSLAVDGVAVPGRRERVAWVVVLLLAVGVTAAVTLGISNFRGAPAGAPEMRVDIVTPGESPFFAISPDGRRVVFVALGDGQSRLWLRPLDVETSQPLMGTEGAQYPFWSPDSESVGFFADGKLKRLDIGSGTPRTLADAPLPGGGAWSPEGVILFSSGSSSPLSRMPATGGDAVAQTALDPPRQIQHSFPQFLPGGRQFLFHVRGAAEAQGIYVGSLDSSETTRLVATDRGPGVYVPPGWLLFVRQGALVAQQFDPMTRVLGGDLVLVADSLALVGQTAAFSGAVFSASASGLVGYRTGGASHTQLTWFDRSGAVLGTFGARDENVLYNPELSPDGRQVAARRVVDNNADIWLLNEARGVRFTFDAAIDQYPVWSPDGNWIAYNSLRKGPADLYRKRASGGNDELLLESPLIKNLDDWSPDGRFLLYNVQDATTERDLWVLPLQGDRKPFVFLKTSFEEHRGQFSPNEHWITYVSNESGRPEIYVRPFPGPGGQWQVSTGGGIQPRWSPDGKELYYIAPDGQLMAASIVVNGGAIEAGAPAALFQTRVSGGGGNTYTRPQYDVARDCRFLVNMTIDEGKTSPITLLLNWNTR